MNTGKIINFNEFRDNRGALISLEENSNIPFAIKRIYYLYDVLESRGFHAHKQLEQVMICVHGSVVVKLEDETGNQSIKLNSKSEGLYIGSNVWREMHEFTPGTIVMVVASEKYDESDYIRDYQVFKKEMLK